MYIYIYKGGKFTVELADWSTSFILRIQKINPTKYLNEDLECRGEGEGEEENRETNGLDGWMDVTTYLDWEQVFQTLHTEYLCVRIHEDDVLSVVLTVQRKMKGTTSLPLARSGSARVKELPPSTGLDVLPKEQDPVEVTLLWYSLRQTRKNVLQGRGQGTELSGRVSDPQQAPDANSLR